MTVESGETTRRAWLKIPAITLTGCLTAAFFIAGDKPMEG